MEPGRQRRPGQHSSAPNQKCTAQPFWTHLLFRGNEFVGMTGGKNAERAAEHFGAWKGASPVYEFTKCKQPNHLRPNPR